ncbi:hypothetical protein DL98DRAFT_560910 [Cadophora sp. DSE1049]|nr:hypothetical protein DL98DRAFT_560910 [Cadophora sp. DSE1049]
MQRRSHKKSRKGCLGCKRRHIKCDENRPSCLNCGTADLVCQYHGISPASTPISTPGSDRGTVLSNSPSRAFHSAAGTSILEQSTAAAAKDGVSCQAPLIQTGMNFIHLELLNNMISVTCKDFRRDENTAREHVQIGIKHGLKNPYLMHEILAVSALHLSTLRPHQQEFYRNEATELQTCALSLFNNAPVGHTSENLPSVVLFSSFLGIHVLFDTLLFRPADFSLFVGRFIEYLRLHRGVFTIVKGSWSRLQETDLRPLLGAGRLGQVETESGTECDALKSLMQSADLSQGSIEACQQALNCLQWVFDALRIGDTEGSGEVDLILAWPIMISPQFTELLSQCQPEALVILAYYAVVLHYRRDLWIINDGGRFLIESITRYLGPYWQQWLKLPASVLSEADSIT